MSISINVEKDANGLIDEGDYVMIFSGHEDFITKNGSEGIKLSFEIVEGPETGKIIIMNLWPYGTEGGARMAKVRIAQIAKASGKTGDLDGETYGDLLDKVLNAVVGAKVVVKDDSYGTKNEIQAIFDKSKVKATPAKAPQAKPVAKSPAPKAEVYEDDPLV